MLIHIDQLIRKLYTKRSQALRNWRAAPDDEERKRLTLIADAWTNKVNQYELMELEVGREAMIEVPNDVLT